MYQKDKSKHSVRLMAYISIDIPSIQEEDVEHKS